MSRSSWRRRVSGSTAPCVYDRQGTLLVANETPFDGMAAAANHIGDISVHDGFLYITADDGDAEADEPDGLWQVTADPLASAGEAVRVKAFGDFRRAGEIEGLDFDPATGEMVVLSNRGKRIVLGMPKGLYPGYDREIHELYIYRVR